MKTASSRDTSQISRSPNNHILSILVKIKILFKRVSLLTNRPRVTSTTRYLPPQPPPTTTVTPMWRSLMTTTPRHFKIFQPHSTTREAPWSHIRQHQTINSHSNWPRCILLSRPAPMTTITIITTVTTITTTARMTLLATLVMLPGQARRRSSATRRRDSSSTKKSRR